MNHILKNWKTTLAGVATVGFAVVRVVWPEYEEAAGLVIGSLSGLGLILAKDLDKSHTLKPLKPPPPPCLPR